LSGYYVGVNITAENSSLSGGYVGYFTFAYSTGNAQLIHYSFIRDYPPNGVMPKAIFNSTQPTANQRINSFTANNRIYGNPEDFNFVFESVPNSLPWKILLKTQTLLNGTTSSINNSETYNTYLPAGTYNVELDVNNGEYKANTTFTISKAIPSLLLSVPSNFTYNGTAGKVSFTGSTYNSQLPFNIYKNGILINTTNGVFSSSFASAGLYNITANTLGNNNYTSASISKLFRINNGAPVFFEKFATPSGTIVEKLTESNQTVNITAPSPFYISTQVNTYDEQLSTSLYLYRIINGKRAFVNGTLINSSNIKLLTPNYTTTYYNEEEYSLNPGTYAFVYNSTGNNNYTGFDPTIYVNVTSGSTSSGGGGGGGSGGSSVLTGIVQTINKTASSVATALNVPAAPANNQFKELVLLFFAFSFNSIPIWIILAIISALISFWLWYKNNKYYAVFAFIFAVIVVLWLTLPAL
jgi:hypothetical protein